MQRLVAIGEIAVLHLSQFSVHVLAIGCEAASSVSCLMQLSAAIDN